MLEGAQEIGRREDIHLSGGKGAALCGGGEAWDGVEAGDAAGQGASGDREVEGDQEESTTARMAFKFELCIKALTEAL